MLLLNAKARRLALRLLFALLAYPRFWRLLPKKQPVGFAADAARRNASPPAEESDLDPKRVWGLLFVRLLVQHVGDRDKGGQTSW